jgi:hypothetical protein
VPHTSFTKGIAFNFDLGMPSIDIKDYDPVVEVELDLPYPTTDPDRLYWTQAATMTVGGKKQTVTGPFGFQRMRLDGKVRPLDKGVNGGAGGLLWTPSEQAVVFLQTAAAHNWGQTMTPSYGEQLKKAGWEGKPAFGRILCRIRLRSAMIWVEDPREKERIYLNAEHLGVRDTKTHRELLRKDRDPQRAADLDIFVYLVKNVRIIGRVP